MVITKIRTGAVVLLGAALVLTACGGSSGSKASAAKTSGSKSSGSKTSTAAGSANAAALQKCLKSHGVKLPAGFSGQGAPGAQGGAGGQGTPPSLPAGVDSQKLQSAFQACGGSFGAGSGGVAPGGVGSNAKVSQAYASCLRDHGVNVPQQGAAPNQTPPTFDRNSPTFAAANKVCGALLPAAPSTSAP